VDKIDSLPAGDLAFRQKAAEALLLKMGITFNVYGHDEGKISHINTPDLFLEIDDPTIAFLKRVVTQDHALDILYDTNADHES